VANEQPVEIFGKDDCPYTRAALRDYRAGGRTVVYHDVTCDPAALRRHLELSLGDRSVPLIVDGGRVSIGYGGA
jgi:glutaredoxin